MTSYKFLGPDYNDRRLNTLVSLIVLVGLTVAILDIVRTTRKSPVRDQLQGLVTSIGTHGHAEVLISNSRTSFGRTVRTKPGSNLKVGDRIEVDSESVL